MAIKWSDDDNEKKDRWGSLNDGPEKAQDDTSAKIDELIHRAEPLVEQVNNLYTMFVQGVERLPPLEKRKQLEQLITTLQGVPKPNQTYSFRVTTVVNHFITFRDRWDKLMNDVDSGKIKRVVKPSAKR